MSKEMMLYKRWWENPIHEGSHAAYLQAVTRNENDPNLNADAELFVNTALIMQQYEINKWLETMADNAS